MPLNDIQIPVADAEVLSAVYAHTEERLTDKHDEILVLMAHGFPGHKMANHDLFGYIQRTLQTEGHHSLRFDFRGCGSSDRREEEFTLASAQDDFQTVRRWAKDKGYKRFFYIGEGLGCAVMFQLARPDVRAYIALWPVLDFEAFARQIPVPSDHPTERGYIQYNDHRLGLPFLEEIQSYRMDGALNNLQAPVLFMHGSMDSVVPLTHLDFARRHIGSPRADITTFFDGEHGLVKPNHRRTLLFQITQALKKYA